MIEGLVAAFPGLVARGARPRVVRGARGGGGARQAAHGRTLHMGKLATLRCTRA